MVSFQAQSLPVLQFKAGRNWCPSSRQSGRSFPFLVEGSTFFVLFKLLTDWRGSPPQIKTIPLLSLLILMLISPWNTLIDTPRRLLDQISEFLEAQSSQCIKWTITKTFHLFPWFAQIYWEDSFLITICWIPTDIHELLLHAGVYFFFSCTQFWPLRASLYFFQLLLFQRKGSVLYLFLWEKEDNLEKYWPVGYLFCSAECPNTLGLPKYLLLQILRLLFLRPRPRWKSTVKNIFV